MLLFCWIIAGARTPWPLGEHRGIQQWPTKTRLPAVSNPTQPVARASNRTTIPASDVGVTLTISEKALAELDRIQEETIKAAQEGQKFSWR